MVEVVALQFTHKYSQCHDSLCVLHCSFYSKKVICRRGMGHDRDNKALGTGGPLGFLGRCCILMEAVGWPGFTTQRTGRRDLGGRGRRKKNEHKSVGLCGFKWL